MFSFSPVGLLYLQIYKVKATNSESNAESLRMEQLADEAITLENSPANWAVKAGLLSTKQRCQSMASHLRNRIRLKNYEFSPIITVDETGQRYPSITAMTSSGRGPSLSDGRVKKCSLKTGR